MLILIVSSLTQNAYAQVSKDIVIPREEFVKILSGIQFLSDDRANIILQMQQLNDTIVLLARKDDIKDKIILDFQDITELQKEQEELFNQETDRLYSTLKRSEFFSQMKDYALVGVVAVAIGLLLMGV